VDLAPLDASDFDMVYSGNEFSFVFTKPAVPCAHVKGSADIMKFMCRQFYASVDLRNKNLPGDSFAE
jgi:hypothetical protein